jgi:CheY-like chemotaxis protein
LLDDEQRGYAQTVRQSADALLTILNDILDLSKIEAGRLEIEAIPFDLPGTLEAVIDLMSPRAREKGIDLILRCDPTVPRFVIGDPGRVRQAILNLAGNAIKFAERGEVVVTVESEGPSPLALPPRGEKEAGGADQCCLRFCVRDTGTGIPEEKLSSIFDSFTQADASTTRRYGGTGLGLAITRRLVELMGGSIGVNSRPGEGSTFWFTLSLPPAGASRVGPGASYAAEVVSDRPSEYAPRSPATPELPPLVPPGTRVLVAEDNVINQKVAARLLEKLGCSVVIVPNGREALTALAEAPYDLVMMDCQMPEMDGFEAAREIRRRERGDVGQPADADTRRQRGVPIIALTANAMRGDRERCVAAGMDDYMAKPIDSQELARVLSRWTDCARRGVAEAHRCSELV